MRISHQASAVVVLMLALASVTAVAQVVAPSRSGAISAPAEQAVAPEGPQSPRDLKLIAVGIVEDVISPDVIKIGPNKITKSGEFTLAGVRTPISLKPEIMAYLKKTLIGKQVGLFAAPSKTNDYTDRYGIAKVHVMTAKGVWVQAELVGNGLAYAYSTKEHADLINTLYKFEHSARRKKMGLWAVSKLNLKNSKTIKDSIGSFQVYEGVASAHKRVGDTNFITFGKQSSDDLVLLFRGKNTAVIMRDLRPLSFRDMPGRRFRVRGWIESNNKGGAAMEITHAQQIEQLDPLPTKK